MHSPKAIIIGSGVAGLAAAIRLAVHGYHVDVFEANATPGGKLTVFEKDGYRFDLGPSLFTQPHNLEELFQMANEPIEEYFHYQALDTTTTYFYEGGKIIQGYTDTTKFAGELAEKNNEDPASVKNYLHNADVLYRNIGDIFLNYSLHKRSTWLHKRVFRAIRSLKASYLFSSMHSFNRKAFSSADSVQLFNRFATYNGSNPYKAPAMLTIIPHLEHNEGVFYPKGGMISITKALYQLAIKKGVHFYFNSPVENIIHNEGKAVGVVVHDKNIYAPVIVSNADIYFTYRKLVNHTPAANKILKRERSSSAIVFYWGIKKEFPQLGLHNILFSNQYQQEFHSLFVTKSIQEDPTIYINITSKMEPGHAPDGKENWFVMINAPQNVGQDWETYKAALKIKVIDKINRLLQTDIEPLIEMEEILDPVGIEAKTGSYAGSLYGSSSNDRMAAFLRHPNFSGYIKGLYLCGGTVHPGGGIPLCFKSAKIATEMILAENKHHH